MSALRFLRPSRHTVNCRSRCAHSFHAGVRVERSPGLSKRCVTGARCSMIIVVLVDRGWSSPGPRCRGSLWPHKPCRIVDIIGGDTAPLILREVLRNVKAYNCAFQSPSVAFHAIAWKALLAVISLLRKANEKDADVLLDELAAFCSNVRLFFKVAESWL